MSPSSSSLRLSRGVPGKFGLIEVHEYRMVGPLTARLVRLVKTQPVPVGAA